MRILTAWRPETQQTRIAWTATTTTFFVSLYVLCEVRGRKHWFCKFFGIVSKIVKIDCHSSCLSVRPSGLLSAWNKSARTGRVFIKFLFENFSKISRELKFHQNPKKNYVNLLRLPEFFLKWEMFETKFVNKITTHMSCSVSFFPENHAVYKIMRKNILELDRSRMTI